MAGVAERVLLPLAAAWLLGRRPLSGKLNHRTQKAVRRQAVMGQVVWEARGRWVLVGAQARLAQLLLQLLHQLLLAGSRFLVEGR